MPGVLKFYRSVPLSDALPWLYLQFSLVPLVHWSTGMKYRNSLNLDKNSIQHRFCHCVWNIYAQLLLVTLVRYVFKLIIILWLVHSHKHHQDKNFYINISGLASVAAAVMSSADSSLLSASSVLTVNTTRKLLDRFNVSSSYWIPIFQSWFRSD